MKTHLKVPFARLKALLESLGFVYQREPKVQEAFRHPCGLLLLYPIYRAQELLRDYHLVVTRRQLVEHGLVADEDEFERLLEQKQTA